MSGQKMMEDLRSAFSHYEQNKHISAFDAQKIAWDFNAYPSKSQILEVCYCDRANPFKGVRFHELCVTVAFINGCNKNCTEGPIRKSKKETLLSEDSYDVFLGGSCNPTTWRLDTAIPYLENENISFYNPQREDWHPSLIDVEFAAKHNSKIQLFVINWQTRGIGGLVEGAYLSGKDTNLVIIVPQDVPQSSSGDLYIGDEKLTKEEQDAIKRGHFFLTDLLERKGIPVFTDVEVALKCTKELLQNNSHVRDLKPESGAIPVRDSNIEVGTIMQTLMESFRSYDYANKGHISPKQAITGLRIVLNRAISLPNSVVQSKDRYTFEEFCLLFAEDMLNYIPPDGASQDAITPIIESPPSAGNLAVAKRQSTYKSCFDFSWFISRKTKSSPSTKTSMVEEDPNATTKHKTHPTVQGAESHRRSPDSQYDHDIFLGGSCGPTNWRDQVIPMLHQAGCTYYNPQLAVWTERMLPVDAKGREKSKVLLYVVTKQTLSTTSLIEAAHYIGMGCKVVLFIEQLDEETDPVTSGDTLKLNNAAIRDHNRGRKFLVTEANREKVPICTNLKDAVDKAIRMVYETEAS